VFVTDADITELISVAVISKIESIPCVDEVRTYDELVYPDPDAEIVCDNILPDVS
jgi:hypothetical protein